MNIRAYIIDDEKGSRDSLRTLIEKYTENVVVIGTADDVDNGISGIIDSKPDLVFLDIKLKTGTGFDVLKRIPAISFSVVFTTAYNEYALKAFKFSAIDYLLKPIDIEELQNAIRKVRSINNHRLNYSTVENLLYNLYHENLKLCISTEDSFEFVETSNISHLEASGPYTLILLENQKKLITSKSLKEFEKLLTPHGFFRVHHSHIINLKLVKRYIKRDGGSVVLKSGDAIPVSRRKKDEFLKAMQRISQ